MDYKEKVHIARNIRIIEEIKAELVQSAASALKALAKDNQQDAADALTGTIISTYLLSRRLGIDYQVLDNMVTDKLERTAQCTTAREGIKDDLVTLLEHLSQA